MLYQRLGEGYCDKQMHFDARRKECVLRAILKNNTKNKNKGRNKFISRMRSPYERVFSQTNHQRLILKEWWFYKKNMGFRGVVTPKMRGLAKKLAKDEG